jgi:hypothetical protein
MMPISPFHSCLKEQPDLSESERIKLNRDYLDSSLLDLKGELDHYILDSWQIDLSTRYGTLPVRNPWGKASGQLSMNLNQLQDDIDAGLGFVVLKTVIAEDESGQQSMGDWAFKEARMKVEPIVAQSGEKGWTVSWKGRGWSQSFNDYLNFFSDSLEISKPKGMLVIPSCKYHLPFSNEEDWNLNEYQYTTSKLLEVWNHNYDCYDTPMPLEKDFSPTLAGSDRAKAKTVILDWLGKVPELIFKAADNYQKSIKPPVQGAANNKRFPVILGLKIFNAMFEDQFQVQMLDKIHSLGQYRPDFFIYCNRLFDPKRTFEDHTGIAYGGPDLSNRNLNTMDDWLNQSEKKAEPLPWSATGNIHSGKMAIEYALRGAESFQVHTGFQLPASEYSMKKGSRTARTLHEYYFHPEQGLIAWMISLGRKLRLNHTPLKFADIVGKMNLLSQTED